MKRLYKNDFDKKVCGVCSGFAEFFGIDPTILRVLWVLFAFFGVGVIAYFACALIMPAKSQII